MRKHPLTQVILLLLFCCQFLTPARSQVIPADDRDLDKIYTEINNLYKKMGGWEAMYCAEFDCAQMQQFQKRLRDAMYYMRHLHFWLSRSTEAQMKHLLTVGNETSLASERAAKVQKILAWQNYIHQIASGMLSIAGMASSLDEIARDPKLFDQKTYAQMLDLLDKFYEGMKDLEMLRNTLAEGRTHRDFPKPIADMMPDLAGISSSEWNDMKSNLSNLKTIMQSADRYGTEWKKFLKEGRGFNAIGQVVGRIVKSISEKEIAERSKLVDDLLRDIVAQDAVQSASYKDLQRKQLRRNKAENIYKWLKYFVIIEGHEGMLTRWMLTYNNRCSFDLGYTSTVVMPEEAAVSNFTFVTDKDKNKSWGQALLYLNPKMNHVASLLVDLPTVSEIMPKLTLTKNSFNPGEDINATFKAPVCYPADSWVGVIKSTVAHNDEPLNSSSVIGGKSFLNRRQEGTMLFKAPQEAGNYELRLYDVEYGEEATTVAFSVQKPADTLHTNTVSGLSDWGTNAVKHRGKNGQRFTYTFPPGNSSATVWGSQPYTDDSPIALAAVHFGLISFEGGGKVTIEIRAGQASYKGTKANGVSTSDYGSWSGSYIFVR